MVAEICDALRSAGANEDKSRKAAELLVSDERFDKIDKQFADVRFADVRAGMAQLRARQDMLTWMIGITMPVLGGVLGGVFTGTILIVFQLFSVAGA